MGTSRAATRAAEH